MPTVFEWKGWKFLFYSIDRSEPPHIHIRKDRRELKFWLSPVALAYNRRCAAHEERAILRVVEDKQMEFLDGWHRYFG